MTSIRLERVSCELRAGAGLGGVGIGPVQALIDVDLEVASGECLTILGPSGSGKSTLLRVIAGLDPCTSGRVWLGDRVVNRSSPASRQVALVFQETTLYPDWTVGEHLEISAHEIRAEREWGQELLPGTAALPAHEVASNRSRGDRSGSGSEPAAEIAGSKFAGAKFALARELGLAELINRKPHQLSGGERRRVALGRAVVREPAAFLFDEPFTGLDPALRWALRADVRRVLEKTGKTALIVTHDWREAASFPGRTAVLVQGRVRQIAPLDELRSQPSDLQVAQAVRDEPLSLLAAWWHEESGEWRWQEAGDLRSPDSQPPGSQPPGSQPPGSQWVAVWGAVEAEAWQLTPPDQPLPEGWVSRPARVADRYRYAAGWAVELEERSGAKRLGVSWEAEQPAWLIGDWVNMVCERKRVMLFAGDGEGRLLKAGRE